MAVPRYEDRVHSGVGQSSAFICSSLALFGLEHEAEFTRPFRFERVGFARSFTSDDLVLYDECRVPALQPSSTVVCREPRQTPLCGPSPLLVELAEIHLVTMAII